MVSERLSPQCVGREFVRQYYTLLNEAPAHLHRFYNNNSSFIHGGLDSHNRETVAVIGQKNIHQRIQQLSFRDCHTKITQVDSQATLGDGVVVQVSGELSNAGQPMRRFNQTFVLAPQNPKKYYVHNDIFRYQDMLDEDLEGEMARSEAEEDQENEVQNDHHQNETQPVYYSGMAQVNGNSDSAHEENAPTGPTPQPEPPIQNQMIMNQIELMQQPVSETIQVNQTPYVNEIQPKQIEQEEQYHQSAPPLTQIDTGNEPKTYANLLKSSGATMGNNVPVFFNSNITQPIQPIPQPMSPPPMDNGKVDVRQNYPMHKPVQNQERNFNGPPKQQNSDDNGNYGGADGDRRRNNQYSESRSSQYGDSHQLFIGNLPPGQTEEQFKGFFAKRFGPVANVKILQKNNKKDYGFVTFEDPQTVQSVLNAKPIKYPNESGEEINVEEKKLRRGGGGGEGGGRGPRGIMRSSMGGGGNGPSRSGGPPGRGARSFPNRR